MFIGCIFYALIRNLIWPSAFNLCPFSFGYCIVCPFSFGYCIVCPFSFCYCIVCPFSFGYCIVCPFSFGYCIICTFSFGYCIVYPFVLFHLVIVLFVLWFKAFHYTFGISNPFSENDQGYIPFVSQNPIFLPAWLNNWFLFVVSRNPGEKIEGWQGNQYFIYVSVTARDLRKGEGAKFILSN